MTTATRVHDAAAWRAAGNAETCPSPIRGGVHRIRRSAGRLSRCVCLGVLVLGCAWSAEGASPVQQDRHPTGDGAVIVGINRTNLAWEPAEVRKSTMEAMRRAGIRVVRLSWREPEQSMLDVLDHAAAHDMAVLIEIPIGERVVREEAEPRPGNDRLGRRYRLSDLDIERFRSLLEEIAAAVAERSLRLVALQVGNEINWADFNGDLPLLEPGQGFAEVEALPAPHRQAFERGLKLYARALRTLQLFRDETPALAGVPILTAGLAEITEAVPASGGSMVGRRATLQRLEAGGGLAAVDGIGLHIYRPFRQEVAPSPAESAPILAAELAPCGTRTTANKPCWITEFGSGLPPGSCPPDDNRRAGQIDVFFDEIMRAGKRAVAGAFYYDWDQGRPWAVFRCGTVTDAGRTLVRWSENLAGP
jgi:hypothetical protein